MSAAREQFGPPPDEARFRPGRSRGQRVLTQVPDERLRARLREEDRGYESPCWIWTGARDENGYGMVTRLGGPGMVTRGGGYANWRVHRYVWSILVGPCPSSGGSHKTRLVADHLCRVPECANPDHIEWVTDRENIRRGRSACREKTHCPAGHPYDVANTYVTKKGKRMCRTCSRERMRIRRSQKRMAA